MSSSTLMSTEWMLSSTPIEVEVEECVGRSVVSELVIELSNKID